MVTVSYLDYLIKKYYDQGRRLLLYKTATMVAVSYLDYLIKKYYDQGRIVIK